MNDETITLKEFILTLFKELKEWIKDIFAETDKRYENRFKAQEEAIRTAERSRDTAIKKAEDSIEKKSDIAYVKISDLQITLADVVKRPELEAKFKGQDEKIDEVKKEIALLREAKSSGSGKEEAQDKGRQRSQWTIGIVITIFFSSLAFLFTVINFVSRLTGK